MSPQSKRRFVTVLSMLFIALSYVCLISGTAHLLLHKPMDTVSDCLLAYIALKFNDLAVKLYHRI